MPKSQLTTAGIDRVAKVAETLGHIDFEPLMKEWAGILDKDNRAAALQGLDAKEGPLEPVTYRPDKRAGKRKPVDYTILHNNNLTNSHYRTLSGPPLAPRREQSRIVVNFRVAHGRLGASATSDGRPHDGQWYALGAWEDYLNPGDRPFLGDHFTGSGNLPQRDLRGVRPRARRLAVDDLDRFLDAVLKKL